MGYMYLTAPSPEEREELARKQDSIQQAEKAKLVADSLAQLTQVRVIDTVTGDTSMVNVVRNAEDGTLEVKEAAEQKPQISGSLAAASLGENKHFILENDLLKLTIASKGGRVVSAELKDYQTYDSLPLILFEEDGSEFSLNFFADNHNPIHTSDLYFEPFYYNEADKGKDELVAGEEGLMFGMRVYPQVDSVKDESKYIEFYYSLKKDEYMIDFDIKLVGMQESVSRTNPMMNLVWNADLKRQEKAVARFNGPTVYYQHGDDEVDYLSETKDDEIDITTDMNWISFKQQFFSSTLISDENFSGVKLTTKTNEKKEKTDDHYLKSMTSAISLPAYTGEEVTDIPMQFYFGPNKYKTMRAYQMDLEQQIPLGWSFFLMHWINRFAVIPVFNFLESFNLNYGIIILILTILLKLVLLPIAYRTYNSSAKMRVLKPDVEEINKKFPKKEDAMKKQQATMDLYKKAGASPMAGCVPMLLQFPILLAMFRFFPASIELRQQPFLWAEDLSTYDSIWTFGEVPIIGTIYGDHVSLFTLLMTITTIIYTRVNNQMMATSNQMPGMKTMMYLMPIMFLGIFNNYAAGLSYYYMLANLITFGQMYLFRGFVDENKLRARIEAHKKKPVKKSNFQKRLEDAQKQRNQQQKRR